jgi:hypothetical protein
LVTYPILYYYKCGYPELELVDSSNITKSNNIHVSIHLVSPSHVSPLASSLLPQTPPFQPTQLLHVSPPPQNPRDVDRFLGCQSCFRLSACYRRIHLKRWLFALSSRVLVSQQLGWCMCDGSGRKKGRGYRAVVRAGFWFT